MILNENNLLPYLNHLFVDTYADYLCKFFLCI